MPRQHLLHIICTI